MSDPMAHPHDTTPANPAQGVSGERLAQQLADIARSLLSRPAELRGPWKHDEESLRRVAALPPRTRNVTELAAANPAQGVSEASRVADALEACDWSGPSIGNKAILQKAVELLRTAAIGAGGQAVAWTWIENDGLRRFADGEHTVAEAKSRGRNITPLYAHPAPSEQAVKRGDLLPAISAWATDADLALTIGDADDLAGRILSALSEDSVKEAG